MVEEHSGPVVGEGKGVKVGTGVGVGITVIVGVGRGVGVSVGGGAKGGGEAKLGFATVEAIENNTKTTIHVFFDMPGSSCRLSTLFYHFGIF